MITKSNAPQRSANKNSNDMKKQINDLLLKMQNGENCIGETANQLLDLFAVSNRFSDEDMLNAWECSAIWHISQYDETDPENNKPAMGDGQKWLNEYIEERELNNR